MARPMDAGKLTVVLEAAGIFYVSDTFAIQVAEKLSLAELT